MGTSQVGINAKKGAFIPYFLSFENRSDAHQARRILNKARLLAAQGYAKVGIIYSANDEQANKIIDAYRANNNNWAFTNNIGSNQGAVIAEIEKLLKNHPNYQDLQKVFVIFPIATMSYRRKDLDQKAVAEQIVARDLGFIREHLENGAAVLGWQNQMTHRHMYAVGGGIATNMKVKQKLSKDYVTIIQRQLNQFMTNFP